jgi:hypothetical protein
MPRKASLRPPFAPLYRQAAQALAALRQEMARREQELTALKTTMARWQNVTIGRSVAPRLQTATSPRLDWGAVLRALPSCPSGERG